MNTKNLHFLIVILALSLVVDVDAGWKFWKKKKDDTSSEDSLAASSTTLKPSGPEPTPNTKLLGTPVITQVNPKSGVAAAADPALAIGVVNTGGKIREDARGQPHKANPGTEVGLDIGIPKPQKPGVGPGGQGYRDWAADLTGAGDSARRAPKLPEVGPDGFQPNQGNNKPVSVPGTPNGQQPNNGNKPAVTPGTPLGPQGPLAVGGKPQTTAAPPTTQRPTAPASAQKPIVNLPQPKPTLPPSLPAGPKSYADILNGGSNSRPGSPTPAPKSPSPTPSRGGQAPFETPKPGNAVGQTGRPSIAPGVGAAALAGGTVISGAAAVASGSKGKEYSSNPTYSKGTTVTDEDLEKLSEALFIKDVNNANKYITLNLQKTTTGNNPKDEAPQPLLQVKPEALQIPTIQKVLAIYDNYKLDTRENEYISPAQRQEESSLIDTFLSTNVMSAAMRFLADKGFVKKDYYEYKDTLRRLWFNLYSRGEGKIGSTGFEHVFLTELKLGTEVSGLHNWIYFNSEEVKNRLDYLGYIKKVDLGNKAAIAKVHVRFNGIDKPVTNVFIGTSPELEMALYTVCFFARPDTQCPVSLGGTKFNILTYKFKYRGKDVIGSAYPEI